MYNWSGGAIGCGDKYFKGGAEEKKRKKNPSQGRDMLRLANSAFLIRVHQQQRAPPLPPRVAPLELTGSSRGASPQTEHTAERSRRRSRGIDPSRGDGCVFSAQRFTTGNVLHRRAPLSGVFPHLYPPPPPALPSQEPWSLQQPVLLSQSKTRQRRTQPL